MQQPFCSTSVCEN